MSPLCFFITSFFIISFGTYFSLHLSQLVSSHERETVTLLGERLRSLKGVNTHHRLATQLYPIQASLHKLKLLIDVILEDNNLKTRY